MRNKLTYSAVILTLLFAWVVPASAITWGEPDGNNHPYVGFAVFFDFDDGSFWSCSGTLLSPTVFLTAGHCAYGADLAGVSFEPVVNQFTPLHFGQPIAHPGFDWAGFPNTNDIGIVFLYYDPVPVEEVDEYGALPELGVLDSLSTRRGRQDRLFTVVGYGLQSVVPDVVPPDYVDELTRYEATSMFINLRNALTDGYNLQTSNNAGRGQGRGGSCLGDSGGPILLDDTNVVVAVVSFGLNPNCVGTDFNYRTDISSSLDFINPYLD